MEDTESTYIFVDGERCGRVLEEDVGHAHFERSQLRDLLGYLRRDEMTASGWCGDGDGALRPPSRSRDNLCVIGKGGIAQCAQDMSTQTFQKEQPRVKAFIIV